MPWFVQWIDGVPDFRVMRPRTDATETRRCWVCGKSLGRYMAYVAGPMCAINRTSAEPSSHRECAIFSATACPFLTRPHAKRREGGLPEDSVVAAGKMIARNPGVALVWVTEGQYRTKRDSDGLVLFDLGPPTEVLWYCEGREATRAEVDASIETGLPSLQELCEDNPAAEAELQRYIERAEPLLPV